MNRGPSPALPAPLARTARGIRHDKDCAAFHWNLWRRPAPFPQETRVNTDHRSYPFGRRCSTRVPCDTRSGDSPSANRLLTGSVRGECAEPCRNISTPRPLLDPHCDRLDGAARKRARHLGKRVAPHHSAPSGMHAPAVSPAFTPRRSHGCSSLFPLGPL